MNLVSFGVPDALMTLGKTCRRSEITLYARQSFYTALSTATPLHTLNENKKQPIQVMFGNG
jgi:hypothetical protein